MKSVTIISVLIVVLLVPPGSEARIGMVEKWRSEPVLLTCESVLYDSARQVLYVSCINGAPTARDGNGYIATLNLKGAVLKQRWLAGLDAPKGMAVKDGTLYVSDIDRVVEIDIEQRRIVRVHSIAGAEFLNDVALSPSGDVYVSDTGKDNLHRFHEGRWQRLSLAGKVASPNGLYAHRDHLLIGSFRSGRIVRLAYDSHEVVDEIGKPGNPVDGLVAGDRNTWIVSDWKGAVEMILSDGSRKLMLNLDDRGLNAADIEYIPSERLLLIPTFSGDCVMAYELK